MPGDLHPTAVAQAFREMYPKKFDDIDDGTIISLLKEQKPDIYRQIDPLLIGAELLTGPPPKPMDDATRRAALLKVQGPSGKAAPSASPWVTTGLRMVPPIALGAIGSIAGPEGTVAGSVLGGLVGEEWAQHYEQAAGDREGFNPWTIGTSGALAGINPGARGAGVLARTASQAAYGAGLGVADTTARSLLERGELPTLPEVATSTAFGGVLGAGLHGVVEGVGAYKGYQARVATQAAEAARQYQIAELERDLLRVYGPSSLPAQRSYQTLLQSKSYLERLAELHQPDTTGAMLEAQAQLLDPSLRGATPAETGALTGGPPSQLALPPAVFEGPPPPPNQLPRVFGQPLITPPPGGPYTVELPPPPQFGEGDFGPIPPPPPPDIPDDGFRLQPPPSFEEVSRKTQPYLLPNRPNVREAFDQPIRQVGEVGGAGATAEQPYLGKTRTRPDAPEVLRTGGERPAQLPSGPNVNPQRKNELHGQPRRVKRMIDVAGERKAEYYDSPIAAEDPATYPPDVRREMATMVEELVQFPLDRIQGGVTRGMTRAAREANPNASEAEIHAMLRQSGATAGGSIPGAPVYWEILEKSGQDRHPPTRSELITRLRAALLEGKGSRESDGAALIARGRLEQRAKLSAGEMLDTRTKQRFKTKTVQRGDHDIRLPHHAGDELIGWVDEAGFKTQPPAGLEDVEQMIREAPDEDVVAAAKLYEADELDFDLMDLGEAAQRELVRRGIREYQQLGLTMEGPGGDKGPSLFDYSGEEEPPAASGERSKSLGRAATDIATYTGEERRQRIGEPPPGFTERRHQEFVKQYGGQGEGPPSYLQALGGEMTDAEYELARQKGLGGGTRQAGETVAQVKARLAAEADQSLPGLEGVRSEQRPMPEVADAPFALTPPPSKPEKLTLKDALKNEMRSLFSEEEGSLILPPPPAGDRKGLRAWLQQYEADHGHEPWFNRIEQAMEDGEWDRAWKLAASRSVLSYARLYQAAESGKDEAKLAAQVRGTALQDDINTQIVATGRAQQVRTPAPKVKDFPASQRIGQRVKGVTIGPAGILNLGEPQQRTPIGVRAKTLDKEIMDSLLEAASDHPDLVHLLHDNRDAALRLGRQITDLIAQGQVPLDYEAFPNMDRYEIGRHYRNTLSEAGRILGAHGRFVQEFSDQLYEMEGRMDIGGALSRSSGRVNVGGGPPARPALRGSRGPITPAAAAALDKVAADLNLTAGDQAALLNDLTPRRPQSVGQALMNTQYAFLTSGFPTAVRNAISFGHRYTTEFLDDLITAGSGRILGGSERAQAKFAAARARERVAGLGRAGLTPNPRRAVAETFEDIYNITARDMLEGVSKKSVKQTLRLFNAYPAQAAHLLGAIQGESVDVAKSSSSIINALGNPKLQRWLQIWNRSQEFPTRALMADNHVRAVLRTKGLDPSKVLATADIAQIAEQVGGSDKLERLLFGAAASAREATYSGGFAKNSIPGQLVHMVQEAWPAKLAMRFPAYNFARAPRYIWDHGPWALADLLRLPFDRAGITSTGKHLGGSRLYRGLQAQHYETDVIPALNAKQMEIEGQLGDLIPQLSGTSREVRVTQRLVDRLAARLETQPDLPNVSNQLADARRKLEQLTTQRTDLQGQIKETNRTLNDLAAQEKKLWAQVQDATGIDAPTYASWFGRMAGGTVSTLAAALIMRSSDAAKGTRYDQMRIDRGEGKDPWMLEFGAFAPIPQYMFVADVMVDFERNTDWAGVRSELGETFSPPALAAGVGGGAAAGGSVAGAPGAAAGAILGGSAEESLRWNRAIWNNYQGKYTPDKLGADFGRAFLSISRMAGTSLTIADLMTRNGWPGLQDVADAAVGTIGQFIAGYATPLTQLKDLTGMVDPEEAMVRGVPRTSLSDPASWSYPLAAGLSRVPFAGQLIPPVISQTSGQPLRSEYPGLHLTGLSGSPRDFIQEEIQRIGLPGSSVFIRETGDVLVDRLVADSYAKVLNEYLPQVLEDPAYQEMGTPALQRDYLQRYIFPALKRAALGEARAGAGLDQYEGATVRGEAARKKARQQKLLERLEQELPAVAADDAGTPASSGDTTGGPPPGP